MRKFKETAMRFIAKYGAAVASCAFAFATISANTSCLFPYYEPEEPQGLEYFKKFNR